MESLESQLDQLTLIILAEIDKQLSEAEAIIARDELDVAKDNMATVIQSLPNR